MDYRWKVTYIGRRNPRRRVPMVAQIHRRNIDIVRPCRPASLCTAIFNIRVDPLETRFELSRIPNLDSCLSRAPGRVGDRSAQSSKSSSSSRGAPAPARCGAVGRCRNCGVWRSRGSRASRAARSAGSRSPCVTRRHHRFQSRQSRPGRLGSGRSADRSARPPRPQAADRCFFC